jgi:hypothetical protein
MQWDLSDRSRCAHSLWIEWQRMNTAEHRERFDGGVNADVTLRLTRRDADPAPRRHEGGHLFNTGPVADSAAAAAGVRIHGRGRRRSRAFARRRARSRSPAARSRSIGTRVLRARAYERDGWRGHLIVWRGRTFIKDEGDPNYQSLQRDGHRYGGTRDYAELGLAKRVQLAPGAVFEVSGRVHRTERYYEYFLQGDQYHRPRWHLR